MIDKHSMEKYIKDNFKKIAKSHNFKFKSYAVYKRENEYFIHADYIIINNNIMLNLYIKKYIYDDIFWNILNMKDNIKEPDSLRAIGAFSAPSFLIGKINSKIDITDGFIESIFQKMIDMLKSFPMTGEFNNFLLNQTEFMDEKILKILAHIDNKDINKAKSIAENEIKNKEKGRFQNEGKDFYELVIEYCNKPV